MTKQPLVSLEIVNFEQEMRRIEAEIIEKANDEIDDLVRYGTRQLKIVTPVDTGKARKGWDYELNMTRRGKLRSATIFNPVEYIDVLNKGHSKQAPIFFIEQVLSTIGLITPD